MDKTLKPIIDTDIKALIDDDQSRIYELTELFGSPLHITFPHLLEATAKRFVSTLNEAAMPDSRVHFAAKANKADSFLAASAAANIYVDASSAQEFVAALGAGVPGKSIGVSGPGKPLALLALAIQHGASIAIDSNEELGDILSITDHLLTKPPVRVSLRIESSVGSRFGMSPDEVRRTLAELVSVQDRIQLEGFSFHVSGYESETRAKMIVFACDFIKDAFKLGLKPNRINIGGGLQVTYAKDSDWSLEAATNREFAGDIAPQFVYPYTKSPSGPDQLKEILKLAEIEIHETENEIGSRITIDLEPGRSLLDQAGITVFRVRGVKPISNRSLVMVDGNSRSLAEFWRRSEFFLDPILLSQTPQPQQLFTAAIASNTCLESDYLARRFVPLQSRPQKGDLLVYVNTAGYQMDSKESEFHRLPTPHKIAALKHKDGWHYVNDTSMTVADLIQERL